jgi:phospholipid/cholesterol/gamma-HCH transport system substrate-binding protein
VAVRLTTGARWAAAVVLAAVVVAIALRVRTRYGWWFVRGPEYRAAFAEVTGLAEGDGVRWAGLDLGRVRRVEIDPRDPRFVLVTFRVREGTPVRATTRASVVSAGAPAARFVNLRPGDPVGQVLAPGSLVATEEGPTMQETLDRLSRVLDRTDTILASARPMLEGDFFAHLARTTARMDTLVDVAARGAHRWGPRLEATVRRAEQVLARTDRVLAALDSVRPALAQAPGEMTATLRETREMLSEVRAGLGARGGLEAVMADLATASDNLARLSARLEQSPVSVLQPRRPARKTVGPPVSR